MPAGDFSGRAPSVTPSAKGGCDALKRTAKKLGESPLLAAKS